MEQVKLNHFMQPRRLHPRFPHAYYALTRREFKNNMHFNYIGKGELVIYVVAEHLGNPGHYSVLILTNDEKRCNCTDFEKLKDDLNISGVAEPQSNAGLRVLRDFQNLYAKNITIDRHNGKAAY